MSQIFIFKERITDLGGGVNLLPPILLFEFYLNNEIEQSGASKYFHLPSCGFISHSLMELLLLLSCEAGRRRCGRSQQLVSTPPYPSATALSLERRPGRNHSPAAQRRSDGALLCGRLRFFGRCGQCRDSP